MDGIVDYYITFVKENPDKTHLVQAGMDKAWDSLGDSQKERVLAAGYMPTRAKQ